MFCDAKALSGYWDIAAMVQRLLSLKDVIINKPIHQ